MGSKPKKSVKPLKSSKKGLKKQNRKTVVKKLDAVFSTYMRLKNSKNGIVECYTCGKKMNWKEAQNGHFFSRARYSTRWDEANSRVQCVGCNLFLKGNYINYTRKMIAEIGEEEVEKLEIKSKSIIKMPTFQLNEMVDEYNLKIKELQ